MAAKTIKPLSGLLLQTSSRPLPLQCRATTTLSANTPPLPTNHARQERRPFISNPLASGPQTLSASRTLHHPARVIYAVISDVASYSQFLPYCLSSTVTQHSAPAAADGKTYPEEAKLAIGFTDGVSEEFWSRVYCVPSKTVEAVSGAAETTLSSTEIAHHHPRPPAASDATRKDTILSHLLTRWTLRPYPYKPPPSSAVDPASTHKNHDETNPAPAVEKTEVSLAVEYQFANPVYGALSQAAAPKVAEKMIEAFEMRVKAVVEGAGGGK